MKLKQHLEHQCNYASTDISLGHIKPKATVTVGSCPSGISCGAWTCVSVTGTLPNGVSTSTGTQATQSCSDSAPAGKTRTCVSTQSACRYGTIKTDVSCPNDNPICCEAN